MGGLRHVFLSCHLYPTTGEGVVKTAGSGDPPSKGMGRAAVAKATFPKATGPGRGWAWSGPALAFVALAVEGAGRALGSGLSRA